jgi:hypothetical protein
MKLLFWMLRMCVCYILASSRITWSVSWNMDPSFLVSKLSCKLVLTGWQAHPNCNLVLNCAGSPRHFLRQKLQDGRHISLLELAKGPCASFVGTNVVLLEVRNQKEECRTWSLITTTSQILTLRLSHSPNLDERKSFLVCLLRHQCILHRSLCTPFLL